MSGVIVIPGARATLGRTVSLADLLVVPPRGALRAHLDRLSTNYASDPARLSVIMDAFLQLEAAGILAKLDSFGIIGGSQADSLLNWIAGNPDATNVEGMQFGPQGFKGDNVASGGDGEAYINLGFGGQFGENFLQDSGHIAVYISQNIGQVGSANPAIAQIGGPNYSAILPLTTSGQVGIRVSQSSTFNFQTAHRGKAGFWAANRSGAAAIEAYFNGELIAQGGTASAGPNSPNFAVGAGPSSTFGAGTYAAWSVGASLTPAEHAILANAVLRVINTFVTLVA